MKYVSLTCSFLALSMVASHSFAAAITNLDTNARKVVLVEGSEYKSIEIKAGETFRRIGSLKVMYHGYEIVIDSADEYAIWKDGTLGPQKRMRTGRGH